MKNNIIESYQNFNLILEKIGAVSLLVKLFIICKFVNNFTLRHYFVKNTYTIL